MLHTEPQHKRVDPIPLITTLDSDEANVFANAEVAQRLEAEGTHINWIRGWHAHAIEQMYGKEAYAAYCDVCRTDKKTLRKLAWVASGFTPEDVNRFPGLPFTMFQDVRGLVSRGGYEDAMDLLERAFHEPGITCDGFRMLVHGDAPMSARLAGTFQASGIPRIVHTADGGIVIGIEVKGRYDEWKDRFDRARLDGVPSRIVIEQDLPT